MGWRHRTTPALYRGWRWIQIGDDGGRDGAIGRFADAMKTRVARASYKKAPSRNPAGQAPENDADADEFPSREAVAQPAEDGLMVM